MSRYVLGMDAEQDLEQIWDFIAEDDIDAADRWLEKLFGAFDLLSRTSRNGPQARRPRRPTILFWPVGAYLILCRVQPVRIEIVAVTQGARDVPAFLTARVH